MAHGNRNTEIDRKMDELLEMYPGIPLEPNFIAEYCGCSTKLICEHSWQAYRKLRKNKIMKEWWS
jgi:hypothetical protein